MVVPGYRRAKAVTKSNTDPIGANFTVKALYIGGTGDVSVVTSGGDSVTFSAVPVGMLYVQANQVLSTGTSATNIVAVGD